MALLDKIGKDGNISSHSFSAGIFLVAIGLITRAQLLSRFNLSQDDEAQLDNLLAHYSTLSNLEKSAFHGKFESLNILREEGHITTSEYKTLLNITAIGGDKPDV